MQHAFSSCHRATSKSEVLLLPIIDLSPSDESCIYSTLINIQTPPERLNIPTPRITFDQTLWLKAAEIIKTKSMNIVSRLDGFHTMMSLMAARVWTRGCTRNRPWTKCSHPLISGKAASRALSGHFLVEAALVNKLMLTVLPCQEEKANHSLVEHTEGEDRNNHGTSGESNTRNRQKHFFRAQA